MRNTQVWQRRRLEAFRFLEAKSWLVIKRVSFRLYFGY